MWRGRHSADMEDKKPMHRRKCFCRRAGFPLFLSGWLLVGNSTRHGHRFAAVTRFLQCHRLPITTSSTTRSYSMMPCDVIRSYWHVNELFSSSMTTDKKQISIWPLFCCYLQRQVKAESVYFRNVTFFFFEIQVGLLLRDVLICAASWMGLS